MTLQIIGDEIEFDFSVPRPPRATRPDGDLPPGRYNAEVLELGSKLDKKGNPYATIKFGIFRGEYTTAINPAYDGTFVYANDFDGTLMDQLIAASGYAEIDPATGAPKGKGKIRKSDLINFVVVIDVFHKLKNPRDPKEGVWVNVAAIYGEDNVPPQPDKLPALGPDDDLPF